MGAKAVYASQTLSVYLSGLDVDKFLAHGLTQVEVRVRRDGEPIGMVTLAANFDVVLELRKLVSVERAAWAKAKAQVARGSVPVPVRKRKVRRVAA